MRLLRAWSTLTSLSFTRLLWSSSTLMVLLPLAGCLLFVLRRHYGHQYFTIREFREFSEFMILIFASFVVPICALAFGTASIGGDREDRTLVFLLVRPIPRSLILLAKFTATLPLVLGLVVGSFWLYCRLAGAVGQVAFSLVFAGRDLHDAGLRLPVSPVRGGVSPRHDHRAGVCLVHGSDAGQPAGHREARGRELLRPFDHVCRRRARGPAAARREWFEPLARDTASWALAGIALGGILLAALIFAQREYRDLT